MFIRRVTSTSDRETFEKYHDTAPTSIVIHLQKCALFLIQVVSAPLICMAYNSHLYHNTFAEINDRDRWDTPKFTPNSREVPGKQFPTASTSLPKKRFGVLGGKE